MSVSFTSTYVQFVTELVETFPEYADKLNDAKVDPKAREHFLSVWKTHTNSIAVQNSAIFTDTGLELVPGFAMTAKLWSELSNNSRSAIWRYLTSLLLIAAAFDGSGEKTEGIWDISGFEHDMEEMMKRLKSGEDGGMKDIFEKLSKLAEGLGMKDISGAFEGLGGVGADGKPKFKIPERLFKGHIAKIAEEIVGEFNPEDFGLSPELLNSNDPAKIFTFLQEIFTQKPDMLIGIAQRIAKKIQAKFQRGDFNRDELIREAEELMKEFSDNEAFSGLFEQLGEMLKGGEKESGNEGSARRREVQERLKKKAAEKAAKKAAASASAGVAGFASGGGVTAASVAAADAVANELIMEETATKGKMGKKSGKK
jgi:hypothetical protein